MNNFALSENSDKPQQQQEHANSSNSSLPEELRVPTLTMEVEGLEMQGMYGVCQCCNRKSKYRLYKCSSCSKNIGPDCCPDHHGKKSCTYSHPTPHDVLPP